ncbi:cytochrome P450, partial [Trifolium medium]|nr:cytochrome P450 [Trifolium medium]
PPSIATRAAQLIGDWRAVNTLQQQSQHLPTATDQQQWRCPRVGWWKCNVDASFFEASGSTGWSWCVCNSEGAFIAAGTNICTHNLTTMEGEAMTILEALREA